MTSSSKTWIVKWLADNAGVDLAEIEPRSADNYFEQGWIDSFTFIRFITELEEAHGVRFRNDDFQDRTFSTVDGLAAMVDGRIQEGADGRG